jgi:hypothetical protein
MVPGLYAPRGRNGPFHAPDHANALPDAAEGVYVCFSPSCRRLRDRTANHRPTSFISENPIVAKVQYWLKITFVFILILFIDSVNRVYRVQVELAAATENTGTSAYVLPAGPHPRFN